MLYASIQLHFADCRNKQFTKLQLKSIRFIGINTVFIGSNASFRIGCREGGKISINPPALKLRRVNRDGKINYVDLVGGDTNKKLSRCARPVFFKQWGCREGGKITISPPALKLRRVNRDGKINKVDLVRWGYKQKALSHRYAGLFLNNGVAGMAGS